MRKPCLTLLPLLLAACSGAGVQPDAGPRLVTGDWGGAHVALRLRADGGTIEYDCAHGTLDGPLLAGADGAFRVAGTHVREHGGPARMGEVLPHEPAVYQGRVRGGQMTLDASTATTALGRYTLRKDAPAQLFKCL
ncbi:hypothetical protein MQC88_11455 [Luteimonas sp. 50]|uniref:Lipoprotein n=1 Tax=Cognatiluteimonas sedimenti TaxID=2927791 RepID=A0ABT0A6E8_9GAMM|nr:hypothetical protein [Lysobacter sedimenti]MCJ0826558.1 hypothetical protein [Lysobacter sedimenti]